MKKPSLVIGIPIYTGVDPLDVAAPFEVFNNMAAVVKDQCTVTVLVLTESDAPVETRFGLPIVGQKRFDQVRELDVLWVPGGAVPSLDLLMKGGGYLNHLKRWAKKARYVTSVCEGAMLLAAAGLLDGYRATTHWAFIPCFARFPAIIPIGGENGWWPRFVVDRNRVTGAGISAGLDESLQLVIMLFGESVAQQVQMTIQYYPDPPVQSVLAPATGCPL